MMWLLVDVTSTFGTSSATAEKNDYRKKMRKNMIMVCVIAYYYY